MLSSSSTTSLTESGNIRSLTLSRNFSEIASLSSFCVGEEGRVKGVRERCEEREEGEGDEGEV